MKYIDYVQLSPMQKVLYNLKNFFVNLPTNTVKFFKFLGMKIVAILVGIGTGFKNFGLNFIKGDWATKISYLIMGFGTMVKGQVIKGLLFLAVQVGYIYYMTSFAWQYISKFDTIGDTGQTKVLNPNTGIYEVINGDNSMLILLYSVMTIFITFAFIGVYVMNTKSAMIAQELKANGKKQPTFVGEVKDLFDKRFHISLLSIPVLGITVFTIFPLIFMILIAFTNYDGAHQPPANLFTWVGFENFSSVLFDDPKITKTFQNIFGWTISWAIIATFGNYILGMVIALMINKKSIKCKSVFRTMFVLSVAVPQFVTLLLMAQMLNDYGVVNVILRDLGVIAQNDQIKFLTDSEGWLPKITVIVVNLWIGIPYTILITSGILMNIPEELYESARIDGASPVVSFFKITLPYMLFVTTPYLIQQFIGNINNFNVIYFLTGGGPVNQENHIAGHTDLFVTYIFNLTMNSNDYSLAATIGILVFVISATVSLITFNLTKSAKNEEEFS